MTRNGKRLVPRDKPGRHDADSGTFSVDGSPARPTECRIAPPRILRWAALTYVQGILYTTLETNTEVQMERIRELRKERGLSQVKLAVMADMDPATLNRLERGTGNPNLKTLERVAQVLGVEVADFFPKGSSPSLFNGLEGGGLNLNAAYWVENLNAQAELVEHVIGWGGYDLQTIWYLEGAAVEFWGAYSRTVKRLVREWCTPTQRPALRVAETRMQEARSAARRAYLERRDAVRDSRVVDELEAKRQEREARYAQEEAAGGNLGA